MIDTKPGGSNPKQYGLPEGATDLQDLIEYRNMNFALGNIFKACYRMGTCPHSDELRDMHKILWFAQREINRLEAEGGPTFGGYTTNSTEGGQTLGGYTVKPAEEWPKMVNSERIVYK